MAFESELLRFGLIDPDVAVPMRVINCQNKFKTLHHPRVTLQSMFKIRIFFNS